MILHALAGVARSNATRSGYVAGVVYVTIDGSPIGPTGGAAPYRVLIASLTIHDALNEVANTASLTVLGAPPHEGSPVVVTLGSFNNRSRLFAGHIVRTNQFYVGQQPVNRQWLVECADWTWRLDQELVTARYHNASATAIATDLVARFAPAGYTPKVAAGLPVVDEISFTMAPLMDAISQLAKRIGGYARVSYWRDVELFLVDPGANPRPLEPSARFRELTYQRDLTQIVTRALVGGGGAPATVHVEPGATTIPIADPSWYNSAGGVVMAGPQRITYGALEGGDRGAIVGPGIAPTVAPTVTAKPGAGLAPGQYQYAYTWLTATGETKPSPLAPLQAGSVAPPTWTPAVNSVHPTFSSNMFAPGDRVRWVGVYGLNANNNAANQTTIGAPSAEWIATQFPDRPGQTYIPSVLYQMSPDARVQWTELYFSVNGSPWNMYAAYTNQPNSIGWWTTGSLTVGPGFTPLSFGDLVARAGVSGIATGPAGVTSRKVYRTAVNGAQLKLLTTLANNTATTIADDAAADSALGANAPASDTSGLAQPTGQVAAGASSLPVSSVAPFNPAGGWARVGDQTIRYTGVSGSTLIGIPPTGDGAIVATIAYNVPVVVAPALTNIPASGAGAIALAINAGDEVNLLVVVDDAAAQAALAALIGPDESGHDDTGVREQYQQDQRISETEARARGTAILARNRDVRETVHYASRDPQTRAGATIDVNLPAPTAIVGTFKIQDVQISAFTGSPARLYPVFTATASSDRLSFEDLLRQLRQHLPKG